MLSKSDYNLRKSALKRQYQEALRSVDTSSLTQNPYVAEGIAKMEARKALRGQGAYSMYTGHGAYSLGGTIGGAIGGALGNRRLGRGLGRALGSLSGMGEYEMGSVNSKFPSMEVGGAANPSMSTVSGEDGAIRVCNTEYCFNLYGNGAISGSGTQASPYVAKDFTLQTFNINPGLEQTFPWLSQIAQNFDEYKFDQLVFDWRPTITDNGVSSNGQVGNLLMVTNYNAASPSFTNVQDVLAYSGNQSVIITSPAVHGIECDAAQLSGDGHKYVRASPVSYASTQGGGSQDIKTYDLATFQVAVQGTPGGSPGLVNQLLGRMYVSYNVVLRKPKFFVGRGLGISRCIFVSGGSETSSLVMGTDALILKGQQNNIPIDFKPSTGVLTFPASYSGTLRIGWYTEGTVITASPTSALTSTGNVTLFEDMYGSSVTAADGPSGRIKASDASSVVYVWHIKVEEATNGVNNTMTIPCTSGWTASTIVQSYIEISEYNSGFGAPPTLIDSSGVVKVPA